MDTITLGALAHVDAGKTSLSESLLFKTNTIRNKGRVDNSNAFLDFNSIEKDRGITIYNKEARFNYHNTSYIYLDTPGHIDLKSETSRAIKVIDYAILIVSAIDPIFNDTIKTFNNLINNNIPTIIFVNKCDIEYINKEEIYNNLKNKLSLDCVTLNELNEKVALANEELLDKYLNDNTIDEKEILNAFNNLEVFPIIFGSCLKDEGIDDLLNFIDKYKIIKENTDNNFKGYVYKITYENNERLTHLKVLSGTLHNKDSFNNEKINEIRLYSGDKYVSVNEVNFNNLCTVKGLNNIEIGTYLPSLLKENEEKLENLRYELITPLDPNEAYKTLSILNDENPDYKLSLNNYHLFIYLSGELQKEILIKTIKDRFNINVSFSSPIIRYKETILNDSIGIGHFEPLRHYAETIVEIKPFNNGIKINSKVNNQYTGSIISFLKNYPIRGILTNSPLTNIEITIIDFKTHLKHTEGGDLIESLKRAIRYALVDNKSKLLEPYFLINIDTNNNTLNSIISTLSNNNILYTIEENSLLAKIPQSNFNDLILLLKRNLKDSLSYEIIDNVYDEAINQEEIIKSINYDYLSDTRNPVGSIFTYNGAGHYVDKENVKDYMHLNLNDYFNDSNVTIIKHNPSKVSEDELKRVWNALYKPKERNIYKNNKQEEARKQTKIEISYKPIIYLVDGYNLMYSIEELKDLSSSNFIMAREKTIDMVIDFKGYVNADLILVFDAYKQDSIKHEILEKDGITIVYTKTNETADTYIENKSKQLQDTYKVITVTSDYLEQLRILSNNSLRLSSNEFINRYNNFRKNNLKKDIININKPFKDLRKLLEIDEGEN